MPGHVLFAEFEPIPDSYADAVAKARLACFVLMREYSKCVRACLCVCVCERESERERVPKRDHGEQ